MRSTELAVSRDSAFVGRPVIVANNPTFQPGTYDSSNDICFTDLGTDSGCLTPSGCFELRRGLCALPPASQPRTHFPLDDSCPQIPGGYPGWPYPDYDWDQLGVPGEESVQVTVNCNCLRISVEKLHLSYRPVLMARMAR